MKKNKIVFILIAVFIASIIVFIYYPRQENILGHKLYEFKNTTLTDEIIIPVKYTKKYGNDSIDIVNIHNTYIFCDKITVTKSGQSDKVNFYIKFKYRVTLFSGTFISLHSISDNANYREISNNPITFEVINSKGDKIPFTQYGIEQNEHLVITFDEKTLSQDKSEFSIKLKGMNLLSYKHKSLREIFLGQQYE